MLTDAEELKFIVLAEGMAVADDCASRLDLANEGRPLTPADYASTSGLIIGLEDGVWVNAPIATYNPNFVTSPASLLEVDGSGFRLRHADHDSVAVVWIPPEYHGRTAPDGRPWNDYVFTHGDRARLSPIGGCAMACKFCNIPYEDPYLLKPPSMLLAAVRTAITDPRQPARHLLISGGTPREADIPYLLDVYRQVLVEFQGLEVDIMMAPLPGLLPLDELRDRGLHQLSVNLEVFDVEIARTVMPHKFRQGQDDYLAFIENAAGILGPGRVRSMLMVGLESASSTLRGVQAVLDAGGVPVLSPFRPDPSTPLADRRPPTAAEMRDVYLEAEALTVDAGIRLGPDCAPCTHNTLTLCDSKPDRPLAVVP